MIDSKSVKGVIPGGVFEVLLKIALLAAAAFVLAPSRYEVLPMIVLAAALLAAAVVWKVFARQSPLPGTSSGRNAETQDPAVRTERASIDASRPIEPK